MNVVKKHTVIAFR